MAGSRCASPFTPAAGTAPSRSTASGSIRAPVASTHSLRQAFGPGRGIEPLTMPRPLVAAVADGFERIRFALEELHADHGASAERPNVKHPIVERDTARLPCG